MIVGILSLSQINDVLLSDDTYFKFIAVSLELLTLAFFVVVLFDSYISKRNRKIVFIIIALILSLILQNYAEYFFSIHSMPFARTLSSIYGYVVRPIIIVLFTYMVSDNWKNSWLSWALIGINAVVYLTAIFSDVVFYISDDNVFHSEGPLRFTCHIISTILLFQLFYFTITKYKETKTTNIVIPLVNVAIIIASILVDSVLRLFNDYLPLLTVAILGCCISYYIWLHHNFVHKHEDALMSEKRIEIMMSQIQPHFILNSLSSISELCKIDPNKASKEIDNFMEYLKVNFSALTVNKLVSVEKEIEHIQCYTELEKMRFEDRLEILYDIKCKNFSIPVLSIQPIVENAIRCGVCQKVEGGYVKISTYEDAINYFVCVEDNGVGFDTKCPPVKTDREHIGISNVQERLKMLCNGELIINSELDKGTKVVIKIPKNRGIDNENIGSR